eukprot:CAMPEP_0203921602 /NCGR_PEP_ID=MMETSP0359-20131031/61731_1 /ASSEMBLY_ACC=CAM_ASM_000338 /TAXON_ID=268821 /ORGANISM="Scrippsiella Hangoei, Strain SHTV-5" /LENGTH=442 /DNA_ID=CAMNT_0050849319 /DNA_START=28 /DNA_END=1356 /DNA_ORIENTATION=+
MEPAVLFVTLEFLDPIFSGNGTYSRSLVASLVLDQRFRVHLLCGCGSEADDGTDASVRVRHILAKQAPEGADDWQARVTATAIPLPTWGRTDKDAAWQEWADGAVLGAQQQRWFPECSHAVVVDWTGFHVLSKLRGAGLIPERVLATALSFCVYFKTVVSSTSPENDAQAFYKEQETAMCLGSSRVLALCRDDADALREMVAELGAGCDVQMLLPPLRTEMQQLALSAQPRERKFLTCCLRLHRQKNVRTFVDALQVFVDRHARGPFSWAGTVTPLLCGAAADKEYAAEVHSHFKDVCTKGAGLFAGCEISGFVGATQLGEYLSASVLNIHTSLYEAYGLTIIEAAAFGVPSVVHDGSIGAKELLGVGLPAADIVSADGAGMRAASVVTADMTDAAALADAIDSLLSNPDVRERVALSGKMKALGYGEAECGRQLAVHIRAL